MKNYFKLTTFLAVIAFFTACTKDSEVTENIDLELEQKLMQASNGIGTSFYILPRSDDFSKIPQDPRNPLSRAKVDLGQFLFHETALATNPNLPEGLGTYSCASCHHMQGGFQACVPQGIADGGFGFGLNGEGRDKLAVYMEADMDVQPIRTPSAMNTAYQPNLLWNGQFGGTGINAGTEHLWAEDTPLATNHLGFQGLETQAIAGLGVHRMVVADSFVNAHPAYKAMFDDAFGSVNELERYNKTTAGMAIAAFERTLLANEAPFQQWLRGNSAAMSEEEKRGAMLFFGKANCSSCHNGPALNSMKFFALGMNDLVGSHIFNSDPDHDAHKGRGGFTKLADDMFKFKVPQLYNLANSPHYGHGASFSNVKEVVEYKNEAVAQNPNVPQGQLAGEFVPLGLTEDEINDLTKFLEESLNDRNLQRYVPAELPSGNCFPNNDATSRNDLGCEG